LLSPTKRPFSIIVDSNIGHLDLLFSFGNIISLLRHHAAFFLTFFFVSSVSIALFYHRIHSACHYFFFHLKQIPKILLLSWKMLTKETKTDKTFRNYHIL